MTDLAGRTVVVTGGNSGLGLGMAHGVTGDALAHAFELRIRPVTELRRGLLACLDQRCGYHTPVMFAQCKECFRKWQPPPIS